VVLAEAVTAEAIGSARRRKERASRGSHGDLRRPGAEESEATGAIPEVHWHDRYPTVTTSARVSWMSGYASEPEPFHRPQVRYAYALGCSSSRSVTFTTEFIAQADHAINRVHTVPMLRRVATTG
jgi:hypothetical protein